MAKNEQPTEIVCFRCPKELADLLEEAKWSLRKNKTDILIEALKMHLDRKDIKKK